MLDLIEASRHVTVTERVHNFEWDDCPGAGFGFDLDENGERTNRNPAADANWEMCQRGVGDNGVKIHDRGIQTYERTHWEPPVYRCSCGAKVVGDGDTQCKCGRWYNGSGQELDAHAMVCSTYAAGYDCMCGEND